MVGVIRKNAPVFAFYSLALFGLFGAWQIQKGFLDANRIVFMGGWVVLIALAAVAAGEIVIFVMAVLLTEFLSFINFDFRVEWSGVPAAVISLGVVAAALSGYRALMEAALRAKARRESA